MDPLIEYIIPVSGLKVGSYSFDFQVDSEFFSHFPDSLIKQGNFKVHLDFEKRIDLYELDFSFEGNTKASCDRCLVEVDFPAKGKNQLIVKFSDEYLEEADVIYIPNKTEKLNVAKYIYEFICLSIPFVKTFDCEEREPAPCDREMLERINGKEETTESNSTENPVWDQLKNIKFN